jgi:lipid II:glycine glycyltransferase (peptidoglycan interpeptide bridge formation enzyme)
MLWKRLSANTRENRAQFLDRSCSYAAALDRLFAQVATYTLAPVDYSALYIQTVEQIDTPPPLAIAG